MNKSLLRQIIRGCGLFMGLLLVGSLAGFCQQKKSADHFLNCFPQCRASCYHFDQGKLVLKNTEQEAYHQTLFVIRNTSGRTVFLDHSQSDLTEGAGWSTRLENQHLSAFTLDLGHYPFVCRVRDHLKYGERYRCVPCEQYLTVCTLPAATFLVGNEGTYWVAENDAKSSELAHHIKLHGIYF